MSLDASLQEFITKTQDLAARRIRRAIAVAAICVCVVTMACALCVADARNDRNRALQKVEHLREMLRDRGIDLDEE